MNILNSQLKAIALIVCFALLSFGGYSQDGSSPISNVSINSNPLIPIDPNTGQPSDTMPKLYRVSFSVNSLEGISAFHLSFGSSEGLADIYTVTGLIVPQEFGFFLKVGNFMEQVLALPAELSPSGSPTYTVYIPVELYDRQASSWRYCAVVAEDFVQQRSEPGVLIR